MITIPTIPFQKIGGKRFFMCNITGLVSTYLVINGYISDSIFRDLIMATVAVYISANTFQVYSENRDKYNVKQAEKDGDQNS